MKKDDKVLVTRGSLEGKAATVVYTQDNLVYVQIGNSEMIPYTEGELKKL